MLPAIGEEDLTDDALGVGGDGTTAVVVFVVTFSGEEGDEMILDGALQMAGHVIIHAGEAERETHGFIRTISGTTLLLHLGVTEVYVGDQRVILGNIVPQEAAQTVLPQGTYLTLTHGTGCCHFSELFFSRFRM